jgi:hypothetical protein
MQKNSQNFSMQDALRLAKSDAGQRLLAILKQSDGQQLEKARDSAATGDYSSAMQALSSLLEREDVRKLLKQLEE